MARKKVLRSPTAANLSGTLGDALVRHAAERGRHFFMFLFYVDAACRLVGKANNLIIKPAAMIQEAATHQVDTGKRTKDGSQDEFDETDAQMVLKPSNAFKDIDASHCCNLGLKSKPWTTLTTLAEGMAEDTALYCIEMAEVFTGNTIWLPQRVNIGPDRIIDQLHYNLGLSILGDGKPVFSLARCMNYAAEASKVMGAYQVGLGAKAGLNACCTAYLVAYANKPVEEWATLIYNTLSAECSTFKLTEGDYSEWPK